MTIFLFNRVFILPSNLDFSWVLFTDLVFLINFMLLNLKSTYKMLQLNNTKIHQIMLANNMDCRLYIFIGLFVAFCDKQDNMFTVIPNSKYYAVVTDSHS